jgi:hygromycin-B 4-O-kinase
MRVNSWLEDFQKDVFAREHFSSTALPIPQVVCIGKFDETQHYCITLRCEGRTLKDNNNADDLQVVPSLFDTLDAIHRIDVSPSHGWGLANADSHGQFDSWSESLLALDNRKFDYDWAALARQPFFEKNLFGEFFQEMKRLIPYCPSDRYLIHRDYGFDNVMTDGSRVTGVLDWAEFGYGDFLYDVAYLDFFSQNIPYGDLWYKRAKAQGRDVPNFQERMRCYMLCNGLHDMAIAATLGRERSYIRGRERTRSVLLPARRAPIDWTQ